MVPPRALSLEIPGCTIAAQQWGPADGRPVLCLHGWLDNSASFGPLVALLPRWNIVAIDLPGHGLSSHKPEGSVYSFVDTVADISDVVDALKWSRPWIIGHSLGAALAAVWAGVQSDRIAGVVLLEGLGPLTETPEGTGARLGQALTEQRDKRGRPRPVYPSESEVVERLCASVRGLSRAGAQTLCERGLIPVPGGVTWRSDPRLRWRSRVRFTEGQVLAVLAGIRCRALFVRADGGMSVNPEVMRARTTAVAGLTELLVEGGHHVHLDAPQRVAPAIAAFIDRTSWP